MRLLAVLYLACFYRPSSAGLFESCLGCIGKGLDAIWSYGKEKIGPHINCVSNPDNNFTLNISKPPDRSKIILTNEQETNCIHSIFDPLDTVTVTSVADGSYKIWEALQGYRCVLVDMYGDELCRRLVRIDSEKNDSQRSVYIEKDGGVWTEIKEMDEFKRKVRKMKGKTLDDHMISEEEDSSDELGITASSRQKGTSKNVVDLNILSNGTTVNGSGRNTNTRTGSFRSSESPEVFDIAQHMSSMDLSEYVEVKQVGPGSQGYVLTKIKIEDTDYDDDDDE